MKKELSESEVSDAIHKIEAYLSDIVARWDRENKKVVAWVFVNRRHLMKGTEFIIGILDEMVLFVEGIIPAGSDKKAAVMSVCGKMFDYIIVQAFPFWLRPLTPLIKEIMVNIVIGGMIDFVVQKYNAGFWRKEPV